MTNVRRLVTYIMPRKAYDTHNKTGQQANARSSGINKNSSHTQRDLQLNI